MGRSPSIDEMEQKEDKFRDYLAKLRTELKGRAI